MEILINERKLDFTLEEEQNVGEVIRGLEKYVQENGNIIVSIYVDDEKVRLDCDSTPCTQDLNAVKKIEIKTSSLLECALNTLLTIGEYVTTILNEYLAADLIKKYDSIMEGMKLIREGLLDVLRSLDVKAMSVLHEDASFADTLLTLSSFVEEYDRKYIDAEGAARLRSLLKNVLAFIPKVFQWAMIKNFRNVSSDESKVFVYLQPVIEDLHRLCTISSGTFEKIGTHLQLGEDKKALQDLFYITELLEEIVAVFIFVKKIAPPGAEKILKEGGGAEEVFHELSVHLKEVETAFRDGDMISVGDVLEYEARPLFDTLVDVVEKIHKIVESR
jgi:hypothetical protein